MTDILKELGLINKHIRQHNREAGESIVWFEFLAFDEGSTYDDVYDEGAPGEDGKKYAPGIVIPTIYIEEIEDRFTLNDDGRQPTQNVHVSLLYDDVLRAGITDPFEYQPRINDMFLYDFRYYKVSNFSVRGRLQQEVVVGVDGFEVYVDQEMMWDVPPAPQTNGNLSWPATLPNV